MRKISKRDHGWLGLLLHSVNPMFREMWKRFEWMVLDDSTETVELEIHANNFRIVANPKYWKKCNDYKRAFIICHEMCHVMFGHWIIKPELDRDWANIAQDIEVNEFLLKHYFAKQSIKGDEFATIASVFKHKSSVVEKNRDYMYYYGLMMQCLK